MICVRITESISIVSLLAQLLSGIFWRYDYC